MTAAELLEKLVDSYRSSFDITRPFELADSTYDAYAAFNVTSAKYVLVKKAELWRANCFEHVFFKCVSGDLVQELADFSGAIATDISPRLICGGEKYPPKNHMYSYITVLYICENGCTPREIRAVRRFRYYKNYLFSVRGYAQARAVAFDLKNSRVYGNRAARPLVKAYRKFF